MRRVGAHDGVAVVPVQLRLGVEPERAARPRGDGRERVGARIAALAGRTFWLNPEPRLYWNYGDSVIAAYERYCEAYECWTTRQLEDFVRALTRPATAA